MCLKYITTRVSLTTAMYFCVCLIIHEIFNIRVSITVPTSHHFPPHSLPLPATPTTYLPLHLILDSLTTFSSSGKLTQIDYAMSAVNNGQPTIGVKSKNGVVILSVLPQLSPLAEPNSVERISCITRHVGIGYSGLGGDYRVLLHKTRKTASEYKLQYGENIPVLQAAKACAETCQEYTQRGGVRPFGCSVLIAGYDTIGQSQLYQIDPAGTYFKAKAAAIGKNSTKVQQFLEKRIDDDIEIEDAIHLALIAAKEAADTPINQDTIHIALARDDGLFYNLSHEEITEYCQLD